MDTFEKVCLVCVCVCACVRASVCEFYSLSRACCVRTEVIPHHAACKFKKTDEFFTIAIFFGHKMHAIEILTHMPKARSFVINLTEVSNRLINIYIQIGFLCIQSSFKFRLNNFTQ